MGGLFSRSSRNRGPRSKRKKGKHKELDTEKSTPEPIRYHSANENEQNTVDRNAVNIYDDWNTKIDQQPISNYNDPPGAPSTYSNNYPMLQNDPTNPSWSSHHDMNNQYYPINAHAVPQSTMSYDHNQYNNTTRGNIPMNQLQQVVSEERSSKKVQFAPSNRPLPSSRVPLSSAQSWQDLPVGNNETATSIPRQDTLISRQVMHRPAASVTNISAQPVVEKPIYVGIDHKATLAERGQRTTHKRQHSNTEKSSTDGSNLNASVHRNRSHGHHQHKHQDPDDASTLRNNPQVNKSLDISQGRSSSYRASGTVSMPPRVGQNGEQLTMSDNETKTSRKRHSRRHHTHATEQSTVTDSEMRPSRHRTAHSQQPQQQQQQQQPQQQQQQQQQQKQQSNHLSHRGSSPLRTEVTRRSENKQETTPPSRNSLSPQQRPHHRQRSAAGTTVVPPPIATNSISATRTRV